MPRKDSDAATKRPRAGSARGDAKSARARTTKGPTPPAKEKGRAAATTKAGQKAVSSGQASGPAAHTRRKPTVAVIGAGRLGTALARALARCGYTLTAVVARQARTARRASELIGTSPHALTTEQLDALPPTDILIITTPDDAIAGTAARLASLTRTRRTRRIALHASGAMPSDVLDPLRASGFSVGSLHPLISVSEPVTGAESLRRAFYCAEGDPPAVKAARRMVSDLGARVFTINTADKALYHGAAVMACGHTVALFDMASALLARCGISQQDAHRVLMPLVRSTMENLAAQGAARALTGPFARADVKTVLKHLDAIRRQNAPDALLTYSLLGEQSLHLAARNGADPDALREIERILPEVQEAASKK